MGMPLDEEFRFMDGAAPVSKEKEVEYPIRRIPTGVPDFDQIIKGGLPSGSVIILLGEDGAGHQEYAYTSIAKIEIAKRFPFSSTYFLGTRHYDVLPERVCYVSFSRSKENVLQEVGATFNFDYYSVFRDCVIFKDFSHQYFKGTVVPSSWTNEENLGSPLELQESYENTLLENLVNFLDENAKDSMVIIDSLTDLVISETVSVHDLTTTLRGLRRAAKTWDGIVYLLLTQDIMDKRDQQMLIDGVDGVFKFEWSNYYKSSKRQRFMYVEKFTSILAHIERKRIAKFPIMISSRGGLVVSNLEMIS